MKKICSLVISVCLFVFSFNFYVYAEDKLTLKVGIDSSDTIYKESWMYNFDMAIIKEIASRMGYGIEFVNKPFEELFYSITANEIDCAIGNIDKERLISTDGTSLPCFSEDLLDFTIPYFCSDVKFTFDEYITHAAGETTYATSSLQIAVLDGSSLTKAFNETILTIMEDGTIHSLAMKSDLMAENNTIYIPNLGKFEYFINSNFSEAIKAEMVRYMLSVRDVYFVTGSSCYLVLMENGDLFLGDSLDTERPQFINSDIKDVVVMTDVLDRAKRVQLLHKNGDVEFGKIHYDTYTSDGIQNSYEYEKIMFLHASEIFETNESYRCIYTVDPGNLYILNTYTNEKTYIMGNVKTCPVIFESSLMVVSKDDVLYSLEYNSKTKEYDAQEIMTNVKDANETLVLRNNRDLYQYRGQGSYLLDTPIRIGTDVGLLTDADPFDNIDGNRYLNMYGRLYHYYANDGTINELSDHATNVHFPDNVNFWRFAGNTEDFYLDFNSNLCYNDKKASHIVYLENVKRIISSNTTSNEIFIITNDGKLYAAHKGSLGDKLGPYGYYKEPFLTVFSQKSTKIYINNKEVRLTAKLQLRDNRTMYPFRECLEQLGANVLWDDVNKIAIGEYKNVTIEFPIGTNEYYINGVQYTMDTASYIDGSIGRTYIPIRYAAEGLGFVVDWNEGLLENTISIHK